MKLKDIILMATEQELKGTDVDSLLKLTQRQNIELQGQSSTAAVGRRNSHLRAMKRVAVIAAALCVCVGSISAAAMLGGFDRAFDRSVDPGKVELLSSASDNDAVTWSITETWFDEYDLYLGGIVTTPEPLDISGRHSVICSFKTEGDDEYKQLNGHIFPSGECRSAFLLSSENYIDENGNALRLGIEGDSVTLELELSMLHDLSLAPTDGRAVKLEDIATYVGSWSYTLHLESCDGNFIALDERIVGQSNSFQSIAVASIALNPFTLKLTGEGFTYSDDTLSEASDTPDTAATSENVVGVWLRQKDGTLLGKESGALACTTNRIEYSVSETGATESLIFCFEKPIDISEVEAIILYEEHMLCPETAAEYLSEDGRVFYPSEVDENGEARLESWRVIAELPIA